ncbi:MAG TPA: hypothetical protein VLH38_02520 [Patescibacteria group bacterium]|nr:hypothetical protein [Patescibacteria group bacterium]
MHIKQRQSGFGVVLATALILVVIVVGASGYFVYHHRSDANSNKSGASGQKTPANKPKTSQDVFADWMTYSSTSEGAALRYPSGWKLTRSVVQSVTGDTTGITSPSGVLTITWSVNIGGLGNEHDSSYPYHTIVNRTPAPSASGLFVVSGITTLDGSTYHPWIAIQDNNGINQSGVAGDVVTFEAKHAINESTNDLANALLSTSGLRASENTPELTQAQATAWFSSAEASQAKRILLSLNDPR